MKLQSNPVAIEALKEYERCREDGYYFAVKYCKVPDTDHNREFFKIVEQVLKEGKTILIKKSK